MTDPGDPDGGDTYDTGDTDETGGTGGNDDGADLDTTDPLSAGLAILEAIWSFLTPDSTPDPSSSALPAGGWSSNTPDIDPYTGAAGVVDPYTGDAATASQGDVAAYPETDSAGIGTNWFTGGQNINAYTGSQDAGPFNAGSSSLLSPPDLLASNDGASASTNVASDALPSSDARLPQESFEGGMSTGPFTPSGPVENQSVDTSSLPPPASPGSTLPEESFEGGMSTGPFTPSGPVENQSVDTSSLPPPASPGSTLPEESFEGGMSTGPFTPSGPVENQSVDTSSLPPPPVVGPADVDDEDVDDEDVFNSPSQVRGANPPATGFDDIDQFLNQQAIDRASNDAVFGDGSYDADQRQLHDTLTAIDNLIPSDAYVIAGGEAKVDIASGVALTGEGFAVAGLDRTTFEPYVGVALAGGPGYGPVTLSGGYEWTTAGSSPIGIVNIGGEAGAGGWATPEEYGFYIYVGEPFFVGLGLGWRW